MVDKPNSDAAERAQEAMSLIDDERVIPWYVKAVDTNWGQMRERRDTASAGSRATRPWRGSRRA